jgi:glycosyltransferase involved in cell wall biosynthesis
MPVVSVVMPVYNGERFLSQAIDSILQQSQDNLELIAVDDGSTDGTRDVLQRYAKEDARVVIVDQARKGIVSALNHGIALSRGKYIARMDADDIAFHDRLAKQCDLMDSIETIVACGTNIIRFGAKHGMLRTAESDAECRNLLNIESCFAHPTVMMRADILKLHSLEYRAESEFSEDYRLWSELSKIGALHNIQKPLLQYRVHSGQVSHRKLVAQRRAHVQIAQSNLSMAGLHLTAEKITDLLWPTVGEIQQAIPYWLSITEFTRHLSLLGCLDPFLRKRLARIRLKNFLRILSKSE